MPERKPVFARPVVGIVEQKIFFRRRLPQIMVARTEIYRNVFVNLSGDSFKLADLLHVPRVIDKITGDDYKIGADSIDLLHSFGI